MGVKAPTQGALDAARKVHLCVRYRLCRWRVHWRLRRPQDRQLAPLMEFALLFFGFLALVGIVLATFAFILGDH